MSPQTLFAALLIVQAGAKNVWTPGDFHARRLAIHTKNSHSDASDSSCIVGGFDDVTTVVHVGGPCSLIDANNQPMDGFRYASMIVVHADFTDANGPNAQYTQMYHVPNSYLLQSQELATHAEVGTLSSFWFGDMSIGNAKFFASQTSYLATADVSFNTVDFVISKTGENYDKLSVCTESCGTGNPSACSGCPSTMTTATAGDYKFSIFAGAYNDGPLGWETAVSQYGTGNPKQLVGVFNVYQLLDFTNMMADNMTITSAGASTTYASMQECDFTNYAACTKYPVTSIALGAAGWEGVQYDFPTTYNRGDWNNPNPQTVSSATTTPLETKTVEIAALKPNLAWMVTMGLSEDHKVILVRYTFDVTGITASADYMSGKWLAYDPSVRTVSRARAASNSGSGSGSTNKGNTADGAVSHGCFAALMAVWFVAARL